MSLHLRDDIRSALNAGEPLVALESTVIAHGLPYPHNLETARELEAVVREAGATPPLLPEHVLNRMGVQIGRIAAEFKASMTATRASGTAAAGQ